MNDQAHAGGPPAPTTSPETPPQQDPYAVRAEYFTHEIAVKQIAGVNIMLVPFIALFSYFVITKTGNPEALGGKEVVAAIFIIGTVLAVGVAIPLYRLKSWARIVMSIFYVPNLFNLPLGTLIGGYFIYMLLHKKARFVCSDEYKAIIAATPDIKKYREAMKKSGAKMQFTPAGDAASYQKAA